MRYGNIIFGRTSPELTTDLMTGLSSIVLNTTPNISQDILEKKLRPTPYPMGREMVWTDDHLKKTRRLGAG